MSRSCFPLLFVMCTAAALIACGGSSPAPKNRATEPKNSGAAEPDPAPRNLPALLFGANGGAFSDGTELWVQIRLSVANTTPEPIELSDRIVIEPHGFTRATSEDTRFVVVPGEGIAVRGTLGAEQQINAMVSFALPIDKGSAAIDWGLPLGAVTMDLLIEEVPGLQLIGLPEGTTRDRKLLPDGAAFHDLKLPIIRAGGTVAIGLRGLPTVAEASCGKMGPELKSPTYGWIFADGRPTPAALEFSAPEQNGKTVSLAEFRATNKRPGKVVLVHFWASWCPPCKAELPALSTLKARLGSDVVVLALASDPTWATIKSFSPPKGLRVLHDSPPKGETLGSIAAQYGTKAVPETYVVDRDGRLRYYFVNKRDWTEPEAEACIKSLL